MTKEIRKMVHRGRERENKVLFFQKRTVYDVATRAVWSSSSLWGQAVLGLPATILNASSHDRERAHRWALRIGGCITSHLRIPTEFRDRLQISVSRGVRRACVFWCKPGALCQSYSG